MNIWRRCLLEKYNIVFKIIDCVVIKQIHIPIRIF